MGRQWPLTGRDGELQAVTAAIRPGAAGILVSGAAGVGKTRLAREAAARSRGAVAWALGSRAAHPFPLGAFAGLVDVPAGDAAGAVTRALDALVRRGRLVLAVDDAHLLDDLSAVVLHRVVVRGIAPVLVTVRDRETAPDLVTALWREDLLPRLDLTPLDAAATSALVAEVLQGPVESASAHRLWRMSRGSPLLLRHLVTEEITSGRLSPTSGLWAWTGDPHLSPRLAALLQHEMGALAPAVRTVVDLVALGEPVGAATLLDLATADAVEEAEGRGLVRSAGGPAGPVVRLAHPLYGEVRRESMGGVRARRLRGLLAARLDGEADPLQRAVLLLDSDLAPDLDLFRRAAARALGFHDLPLAERLARAASAAGASTDVGSWDARLLHASILSWLSRGAEAETVLAELVTDAPSGELRARARVYRAGNLLWTLARADEARSVLHGALDAPDAGPARPAVEAMAAALDAALGDARAAVARGRAVLAHHPDDLDDLTRTLATVAVAAGAAVTGRTDLLDEVVRDGGAVRLPGAIPVFGLADWVLLGYRLAGDTVTGVETTRALLAASADLPGPARVMGLVLGGHAALATGHVREALTPLREAWAALEPSPHEFRFRCRALLATAAALAGEPAAARPLLDGLAAHRHPAYALLAPDDALAQAWGAAAEGAVTEAVRLALGAAGLARRQASPALEVQAWQAVTQLGGSADAVTRLTALVTEVSGPRAGTALAHARAWAAADGDGLRAASGAWERWGDLVAAGDAAAQAAEVDRRHGRAGSAVAAAARAQRIADRSGARTPALATAARPLPLTAREREVVGLAARGLSNREIAGRLTVSVRTVEGHLYRAGHKLDISDRARFADLLGDG